MKRFIQEYAKYQKESMNGNKLMQEDIKKNALNKIDNILIASERGLITVNETMLAIANVLSQ